MRKARIVCTIGPATQREKILTALIESGMDVARLNFSHGDYTSHGDAINSIRAISGRLKKPVAILQDLQGIKIRVGQLEGGKAHLVKGRKVMIVTGDGKGDAEKFFIDYPWLIDDAKTGDTVLLDDGLIQLQVVETRKDALVALVVEGGMLKERKGVNLPHMKISAPFFTAKDRKDLEFGIAAGVDYVALSFVRTAGDVRRVKKWLREKKVSMPLIAKIEKEEAIRNIDGILAEVDGIMVARGDLGVEMPLEEVPMFQKMLIQKANHAGRLVITATQMLESMTVHQRPTRAETTDVANAVLDGTDALMLSAETSTGTYPVDAVKVMNRIITFTENVGTMAQGFPDKAGGPVAGEAFGFPAAVAHAVTEAARDVKARWIVTFTRSGFTAKLLSKFRPSTPVLAFSADEKVVRQMSLLWGVTPHLVRYLETTEELIDEVDSLLKTFGYAIEGDMIIIVASHPPSISGKTNFMKMHVVR